MVSLKIKITILSQSICQLSTTKEEVAVLQVLSEICPPMLNKSQQTGFNTAYNVELKINADHQRSSFSGAILILSARLQNAILNETRQWTLSYPKRRILNCAKTLPTVNNNFKSILRYPPPNWFRGFIYMINRWFLDRIQCWIMIFLLI